MDAVALDHLEQKMVVPVVHIWVDDDRSGCVEGLLRYRYDIVGCSDHQPGIRRAAVLIVFLTTYSSGQEMRSRTRVVLSDRLA
jgi:hypothetical protein